MMTLKQFAWQIFKPYRYYILMMLITGCCWGCYVSFAPYLLKIIIDNLAHTTSSQQVYLPAIAYVGFNFFMGLMFRLLDWIKYKILPAIKKTLHFLCLITSNTTLTPFFKTIFQAPSVIKWMI